MLRMVAAKIMTGITQMVMPGMVLFASRGGFLLLNRCWWSNNVMPAVQCFGEGYAPGRLGG